VIYTGGYLNGHPRLGRFYAFLIAFMASMLGVVLADNLLLLFVFWELTSLTSYFLIGFDSEQETSRQAALQALLVTGIGGLILLAGLLMLGASGGTFEISELLLRRELVWQDPHASVMLVLILLGAFTKSAQFPFHFWLPNAMAAPTPASAYLHSSTMVKAGIYLLARLHVLFEETPVWFSVVTSIGAITMLAGAYMAIKETYFKRVLAYSTMSVLGLLTMLLGMGGQHAVEAAMVFLIAHAFYKAGLFLVAGAVDHETGVRDLKQLGGLARAMPLVAGPAVLLALSMAGVIGTFGFLAKEMFFEASLHHAASTMLTAVSLAAGLLMVTVACLAGWKPFFGAPREYPRTPHNGPPSLWLGPLILAALGLVTGLAPAILSGSLISPAVSAVRGEAITVPLKVWHGFNTALLLDGLALVGGMVLFLLITPLRDALNRWDLTGKIGPARWYDAAMAGLARVAEWQTRLLQNGYLRIYLITIVLATVALVGGVALVSHSLPPDIFTISDLKIHELGLSVMILIAAVMVVHVSSRLAAIAALGVVGYGVGILYVMFGAPDLAITQFVIETLTVILFVLVFYRLKDYRLASTPLTRCRDIVISLSAGAMMTVLVLLSSSSTGFDKISAYYGEHSVELAHGRNIVNVILVDFRGIDTLGEITVLAIAGIGVFALLKLKPSTGEEQP
jgi:multicomponent Na+:H+ antiporter subunit A